MLDQTRDLSGTETHRLTSLYAPPDFVKRASAEQLRGNPNEILPTHLYADQRQRLYPCHTPAATWMSALFFMDKSAEFTKADYDSVSGRLVKSAQAFHILPELNNLWNRMTKDASDGLTQLPDSAFALVWKTDGGTERHYPLRNSGEVKMAASWFQKYRDEFTFPDRRMIASRILEKASEFEVRLNEHELLEKTAGHGYCAAGTIMEMLEKRATLVNRSHPEYALQLRNMVASMQNAPARSREYETRCKMAELLDQFDRQTHINRLYDDGLERPEEVLFQVNEKAAAEFVESHVTTVTGSVYEKDALAELDLSDIRDWMGDEFANAVSHGGLYTDPVKLATILSTLPRGDAAMFDRLASERGVAPVALDKDAGFERITTTEIDALAGMYQPAEPESATTGPLVL